MLGSSWKRLQSLFSVRKVLQKKKRVYYELMLGKLPVLENIQNKSKPDAVLLGYD